MHAYAKQLLHRIQNEVTVACKFTSLGDPLAPYLCGVSDDALDMYDEFRLAAVILLLRHKLLFSFNHCLNSFG